MYPVMLNVSGKLCTIIGGGRIALRKARKLIQSGANVNVISLEFCDGFDGVEKTKKSYETSDLDNSFLVIAATDNSELNKKIANDANSKNILVSLVDDINLSDFVSPASTRSGDVTISVSTNGKFPALAKKLCKIKSDDLSLYSKIIPILEKYRQQIISENRDTKSEIISKMISDEMLEFAKEDITLFEQKLKEIL